MTRAAPSRGDGAAPIAVHPIAEEVRIASKTSAPPNKAQLRRHPTLQHPGHGHAHRGCAEKDADPGMAQEFSDRQHHSLRRGVHRGVSWMLDDVKRIEENPQGMRRICQPPVSKRVCREQITELVVNLRLRHGHPREAAPGAPRSCCADRRQRKPFVSSRTARIFAPVEAKTGASRPRIDQTSPMQVARTIQSASSHGRLTDPQLRDWS